MFKKLFHRQGNLMKFVDKHFMLVFISFVFGFLLSFFLCWETILYIITLFNKVNGIG